MNRQSKNMILVVVLVISSLLIYLIQDSIFHRTEDTLFYIFQDLAFLPFEVAIVTFIIDKLLHRMEQQQKMKKINVLISTFFTEIGSSVFLTMSHFDRKNNNFSLIVNRYEKKEINKSQAKKLILSLDYDIFAYPEKLESLAMDLVEKKSFLINLLENSNLLEHDSFTDMLWAVFHVADELQNRNVDYSSLPEEDITHLSADILRAYTALAREWIGYMIYLHDEYPYLYKTAKQRFKS